MGGKNKEYITVEEYNEMTKQWNEAMNLLNHRIDFLKEIVKQQSERLEKLEKPSLIRINR